jgi:hypothetical protein
VELYFYIGKGEKVLKDIDNLIELAFLVEAINSRKLTQLCKKRETNAQRRAIKRINSGMGPFKRSKCRKYNWIRVSLKRKELDQFLDKEESLKVNKDSQKLWLWVKKKKKY